MGITHVSSVLGSTRAEVTFYTNMLSFVFMTLFMGLNGDLRVSTSLIELLFVYAVIVIVI